MDQRSSKMKFEIRTASATLAVMLAASTGMAVAGSHSANTLDTAEQELSHSVVVKSVTAAADGFVVIHAMKDGKPVVPDSIGHTYIKAGTTKDVYVPLTGKYEGDTVIAMLHVDDGKMGVYEFGPGMVDTDKPVTADGGAVVSEIKIDD